VGGDRGQEVSLINDLLLFDKKKIRSVIFFYQKCDENEEDMKQNINIRVCLVWK
jgi:hypothetical protein